MSIDTDATDRYHIQPEIAVIFYTFNYLLILTVSPNEFLCLFKEAR